MKTIREYLEELASRTNSTVDDEKLIEYVMFRMQLSGRVTGGIVYLQPYDHEPIDIHTFAKMLLGRLKQ
jgi:hypothetical protein